MAQSYAAGTKLVVIEAEFGISHTYIHRIAREFNLPRRPMGRPRNSTRGVPRRSTVKELGYRG